MKLATLKTKATSFWMELVAFGNFAGKLPSRKRFGGEAGAPAFRVEVTGPGLPRPGKCINA